MGLMDMARDAAKKAQDVAQKGVDEARDKAAEVQHKRKWGAAAQQLGELVYRQREGEDGLDEQIEQALAELRGLAAEHEEDDGD